MGGAPSTGPMTPEEIRTAFDPRDRFEASRELAQAREPGCDALAAYCVLGGQPARLAAARAALARVRAGAGAAVPGAGVGEADPATRTLDRSLGCVLGNVVGDALGAPLEFSDLRYGASELTGLCDDDVWQRAEHNRFRVQPGQWTDDSSMALCLADSLLCSDRLDALDLRQRFHLWNRSGYNNAFGRDPERRRRASVGLGGNISESIEEWEEGPREPATAAGNRFTSGNGSIMRNGAVPVWFRGELEAGMAAAYRQSKTTHGGEEAAELCRLLTFICTRFINGSTRRLLDDLSEFHSPLYTVRCLAAACREEPHPDNAAPVFGGAARIPKDRCWDWRASGHRYCRRRARKDPGYIGSYAMDCMSMALHCVYSTQSFEAATLKAANLCGDADTVCAVVGQLAGALYGASAIPEAWLERVQRWDGGSIAARALMLHDHEALGPEAPLSDAALATAALLGTAHGGSGGGGRGGVAAHAEERPC